MRKILLLIIGVGALFLIWENANLRVQNGKLLDEIAIYQLEEKLEREEKWKDTTITYYSGSHWYTVPMQKYESEYHSYMRSR